MPPTSPPSLPPSSFARPSRPARRSPPPDTHPAEGAPTLHNPLPLPDPRTAARPTGHRFGSPALRSHRWHILVRYDSPHSGRSHWVERSHSLLPPDRNLSVLSLRWLLQRHNRPQGSRKDIPPVDPLSEPAPRCRLSTQTGGRSSPPAGGSLFLHLRIAPSENGNLPPDPKSLLQRSPFPQRSHLDIRSV